MRIDVQDKRRDAISAMRLDAYRQECDPLFFKWQRGEATQQEYLDAVESVRQRYPYPTE